MDEQELIRAIEKSSANTSKSIQQLVAELKKPGRANFRDIQNLAGELTKLAKNAKTNNEEFKQLADQAAELARKMSINAKLQDDINSTASKLVNTFFSLGDAAVTGKDNISFFTESVRNFPFVGAVAADLGKSLDFNIDQFRALASVGADFSQSLVQLRIASRDAFLPLLEFTDLVAKNSSQLAGLFGSVNQGAVELSKLTRSVRSNLIPEFAGLGITTENLNEFLGTFFELQRIQNRSQFRDQEQATQAIRSYTIEVDRIARLTGVQREALNDAIRAQRDDSVFQAYLRGLSVDQANQQQALVAGLQGLNPAVGDAVKNILSTGFPLGEFESTLVGTTDGLLDNILALKSGEISTVEFTNRLAASSKQFANTFDPAVLRAGGVIGEVGNNLLALNRNFANLDELTEEQRLNIQNFTAQIGRTQEQLRVLGSQFEGLNTAVLSELGPGLGILLRGTGATLEGVNTAINFLSRQAPSLVATAVIAGQAGKYIFDYATQVAIIAAGTSIGFRGFSGTLAKLGLTVGSLRSVLFTLGRSVAVLAAGLSVFGNIGKIVGGTEEEQRRGTAGLTGNVLGGLAAMGVGRALGGTLGGFLGGPAGLALGAIAGGAIADILTSRDIGTIGATGLSSEPSDIITKVQKGERVLTPQETAAYNKNDAMSSSQLGALLEANQQMVKSLNTLVGISAKTEKNTETSTRRLANFGNLV
jgi:hypothetical protein